MTIDEIRIFYIEAFRALDTKRQVTPEIIVSFYAYVGINHTIRIRDGRIIVRIGELCRDMPPNVHKALAYILVSKLLRRRVPKEANRVYLAYSRSDSLTERARENKRAKGKKVLSGTRGAVYDLEEIFEKVNLEYFGNTIPPQTLTWSARKTVRILGHHDPAHSTIVISRTLDSKKAPEFIVEYVMFHEMLHVLYPSKSNGTRRVAHSREFRAHEREFARYHEAEHWIAMNARKIAG